MFTSTRGHFVHEVEHTLTVKCSAVCLGFLTRLYGSVSSAHTDLTPALVEEALTQACTVAQGKEARLVRKCTKST